MVAKHAFVLLWPFLFELPNQRSIVDPGFINPSDDLRGAPSKSGLTPDQNQPGVCVWGCLCLQRCVGGSVGVITKLPWAGQRWTCNKDVLGWVYQSKAALSLARR